MLLYDPLFFYLVLNQSESWYREEIRDMCCGRNGYFSNRIHGRLRMLKSDQMSISEMGQNGISVCTFNV